MTTTAAAIPGARLRLLYDLGCAFAARTQLDELIAFVVGKCREVFDAEGAAVLLLDAEANELYFPYATSDDPEVAARLASVRFPADHGIAGAVLASGRSLKVDDVAHDPRFYRAVDRRTGAQTRALITAPLTAHQGPIGVLQVLNRHGGVPFSDDDLAFLEALAGSVAVAIENARLYDRLRASEEALRGEVTVLRRDLARRDRFTEIVGNAPAMLELFRLMESAAASTIAVLITGETGTGKELVARGIHRASARANRPFVAVNCAALPEPLLESELFGHRRGAFTGAISDQRGLFEAADGGTILLDEIGDMPTSMQAKLLRVLQEGEFVPVGDTRPRRVDVRVVSATNRDLRAETAAHRFREDLYYRVGAFPIAVPPLRERRDDIPLLAARFLATLGDAQPAAHAGMTGAALDLLQRFDWPGNVRELQNELERAVALLREGQAIAPEHLSLKLRRHDAPPPRPGERSLQQARAAFEARHIGEVLAAEGGDLARAARALGVSRAVLERKLREHGLADDSR